MKIITIVGARPQFIKAAPFSELYRKHDIEILVHTGQHYDVFMSDIFFNELNIPKPNYYLGIGSGTHGQQTGRMLEQIEKIIIKEKPDGVLVYGDTNSTLAGALAASKLHVPVFHVEAGLRSYNKYMPEEQNRIITDHISDLLLCPTQTAVKNLAKEGITSGVIYTGDIMYDAVLRNINIARGKYKNGVYLNELTNNKNKPILLSKNYYLATIHRAENTDNPKKLKDIFSAFSKLDKLVLVPLHPRTRKQINTLDIKVNDNVVIINPVSYLLMLYLIENAYMVMTDSGGLQKEAYFLKTPCTTLRDQTEWIETLENEWNVLCPIDIDIILKNATRDLRCLRYPQPSPFGDGHAVERIYKAIKEHS